MANVLKSYWGVLAMSLIVVSCLYRQAGVSADHEHIATDSLRAIYQDSIVEFPQKVLELFSEERSHLQDSLCFYKLLSCESRCYYYQGRIEEALRTNEEVIRFCRGTQSSDRKLQLLAEAYNNRGVYWQEQSRRDSAIVTLKSAVETLYATKERGLLPSVYINLADSYLQNGNYSWCGYYYRRALWVADSLDLGVREHFAIYSGLAKLYVELDNYREADKYFLKAEQTDSLCTPYEHYFFANTRGNYYYNTKEYGKALEWFRRADRITDAFPQPVYKAIVRGNMGEIFVLSKQADSAHVYLDEAARLFGSAYEQPAFRYYMDGLYAALALLEDDLPRAERLLTQIDDQELVNPLYIYYHHRRMQDLYYKKEEFYKSYEYMLVANALKDSLQSAKEKNCLEEIKFRYQQDTLLLEAENEALRWRLVAWYCILAVLILCTLFVCWNLYRQWREEQRIYKQMATMSLLRMEVVRNRISPHFIFNVLNIILPVFRQYDGLDKPIRALIRFLRSNMLYSEQIAVPLKDEIRMVREYLRIFLIGNPDRIQISWDLPDEMPDTWRIPSMFIQIPVENAVKYAFDPEDADARIQIRVVAKQESLHIDIIDNGIGFSNDGHSQQGKRSTGYGLKIIGQTVELLNRLNENKMSFVIQDRGRIEPDGHGTWVSIVVPFDYTFDL